MMRLDSSWVRMGLVAGLVVLLTGLSAAGGPDPPGESAASLQVPSAARLRIGTTFSSKQCLYLGIPWKETYLKVLSLEPDILRLGAYWDQIEEEPGEYRFEELDWQIAHARRRKVPVLLTVGMKAPRWPEYHLPPWVRERIHVPRGQDISQDAFLRGRTLAFIRAVVERYRDEPIIQFWQVENEPMDRSGPADWWIGPEFLEAQADLIRELDPSARPIVINTLAAPNPLLRFLRRWVMRNDPVEAAIRLANIVAVNVYPIIGHRFLGCGMYFVTKPEERVRHVAGIADAVQESGRPLWVTELQAEPWEPGHLAYQGRGEPLTGRPEQLRPYFKELTDQEIQTVFLWGCEYWYYRKLRMDDPSWWKEVASLLEELREARGKLKEELERSIAPPAV
ncbi:MAG: hypothetical protein COV76_06435 [Candidatus Omnitrophica bacterium CG11_big_fil_rev_8_21_14_0_20_64_10]|nr:MAG: hypothetical protein COV76_06435 [Candidatus Omnitrophica bacterium CG11_big_fil_rev_8_21_14_0_20_64_10]